MSSSLQRILFFACVLATIVHGHPLPLQDATVKLQGVNVTLSNINEGFAADASVSISSENEDPLLTVSTSTGTFAGAFNATSGVYHWLGMPYAADTGDTNRFQPPRQRSVSDTDTPQDATKYGFTCPQYLSSGSKMAGGFAGIVVDPNQGEDCLSANVWVGKNVRNGTDIGAGAPVMLFLYGGSFTWGGSNNPLTDGNEIVRNHDDVIVVTINYRINIFGFPRNPQLQGNAEGINLGLLDRDFAIEWVQTNIAAFGGNGEAITLWGQSAGGSSVDAWAFSHSGQNGLPSSQGSGVTGLIIESGAVQGLSAFISGNDVGAPSSAVSSWNQVASKVGCGTAGDAAQLACMQAKPFADLIAAIDATGQNFAPTPDEKTWFSDFETRALAGNFANVPILIANNADEGTIFGLVANSTIATGISGALITPLVFQCPAADSASLRVKAGVPTFRAVYYGNWDDVNSGYPELAAYHGSEIEMVWGSAGPTPVGVATNVFKGPATVAVPGEETATISFFMNAWTTFAKDPVNGLPSQVNWPRYDPNPLAKTVAAIAVNNSATVQYETPQRLSCGVDNGAKNLLQQLFSLLGGWI